MNQKQSMYIIQTVNQGSSVCKSMNKYDHNKVESKWREKWKKEKTYYADPRGEKKYYVLVELTYSSGDLHMGHWYAWTSPDVFARFKRMQGYNVLFPVGGFDSFGLPAENAAIKRGIHPRDWTNKNIATMRRQFATMGPSFDWDKEVITSESDYYRWTQWLFLELYNKGLAYKAKAPSNWCPKCKTVLANEHVEDGCCWRHTDTPVVQKDVEQWLFKITKYADRLIWPRFTKASRGKSRKMRNSNKEQLADSLVHEIDWPDSIVEGQNNWIGRKEGINIKYKIAGSDLSISCWTSRPDTNFGATFIVVAPEHPILEKIVTKSQKTKVSEYIKGSTSKTERARLIESRKKTGVFTGSYAINDLTGEKMPVWVSDFVLMDFGTGAVVGVPGHDKRDFEFASTFGLPIKRVVVGPDGDKSEIKSLDQVQEEEGTMINSGFLDGLDIHEATQKVMDHLEKKGWGTREVAYHLRDWSISRQRYWGAPIPVVYCRRCWENRKPKPKSSKSKLVEGVDYSVIEGKKYMIHALPDSDLPVKLPYKVDYTPTGKAPLATADEFVNTKCPKCGGKARRETETMDTYVDSSWYFLRYPDPDNEFQAFDPKIINEWFPLEIYFGGPEHTLGHTLYARFITKVLCDLGHIKFDEFAKKRRHHGIILGPDGYRMSKSRGNVVNPDAEVEKYGADAVRLYLCFMGPHGKGAPWSREGIEGAHKFLQRVWNLISEFKDGVSLSEASANAILQKQHKTIKKVSEDIENLRFNTAVAAIMEYVNTLREINQKSNINSQSVKSKSKDGNAGVFRSALETLCLLLAPFAPFMMEEIWSSGALAKEDKDTGSIHRQPWPGYESELTREKEVTIPIQVNGKLRSTIRIPTDKSKDKKVVLQAAKKDQKISKYIKGKKIKKEFFVPGKLVNFVVG